MSMAVMKSSTGMKVYTAADFPKVAPTSLGEIASYYILNSDNLTPKEQNAWNYMQRKHGAEKLWQLYEEFIDKKQSPR